jgi:hypothetical protein
VMAPSPRCVLHEELSSGHQVNERERLADRARLSL